MYKKFFDLIDLNIPEFCAIVEKCANMAYFGMLAGIQCKIIRMNGLK